MSIATARPALPSFATARRCASRNSAQPLSTGCARWLSEVRKLHDQKGELRLKLLAPVGHEPALAGLIATGLIGVGLTLVPHDATQPVRFQEARSWRCECWSGRRQLPTARAAPNPCRPAASDIATHDREEWSLPSSRNRRALLRRTIQSAQTPRVEHIHDDDVLAGLERAGGQVVDACRPETLPIGLEQTVVV